MRSASGRSSQLACMGAVRREHLGLPGGWLSSPPPRPCLPPPPHRPLAPGVKSASACAAATSRTSTVPKPWGGVSGGMDEEGVGGQPWPWISEPGGGTAGAKRTNKPRNGLARGNVSAHTRGAPAHKGGHGRPHPAIHSLRTVWGCRDAGVGGLQQAQGPGIRGAAPGRPRTPHVRVGARVARARAQAIASP